MINEKHTHYDQAICLVEEAAEKLMEKAIGCGSITSGDVDEAMVTLSTAKAFLILLEEMT